MQELTVLSVIIRFILESAFVFLFFRCLPDRERPFPYLAYLAFVIVIPLFFPMGENFFIRGTFSRFFIRTLSVFLYLLAAKKRKLIDIIYFSMLFSLCMTACHNIFLMPGLSELRNGSHLLLKDPIANMVLIRAVEYLIVGPILYIVWLLIKPAEIKDIGPARLFICVGLSIIEIYVKDTLFMNINYGSRGSESVLFTLIILLSTFAVLVLMEYYFSEQQAESRAEAARLEMEYQYEAVKAQMRSDERIRSINHDMKNHLAAIMALSSDPKRQIAYIEDLTGYIEESTYRPETGNELLDGLLAQKLQRAADMSVKMNLCIDMRDVDFIEDMDLCMIFSNAIDNGIEAASKVEDKERRRVHIKTGRFANFLTIRFENYFLEMPKRIGETYITTKRNTTIHGIGIKNIKRCISKYDGTINIEITENKLFIMTILLPFPEKQDL